MQIADRLVPLQTNVFAELYIPKVQAIAAAEFIVDPTLGSSDRPTAAYNFADIANSLYDHHPNLYVPFNSCRSYAVYLSI